MNEKKHIFALNTKRTRNMTPTVSVIIPNYNYAQYLRLRLDSVLAQTYQDFEVILLDDASTDGSVEIIDEYRNHEKVSHVVINEENTGSPFRQWLRGIELAKGEYCWIAEVDDLAQPDFLETCVGLLQKNKDASICYVGSDYIDEHGSVMKKDCNKWGAKRIKKGYAVFDGDEFNQRNMFWRNYVMNASGVLFRRNKAMVQETNRILDYRYCGDWLFWAQLARQGEVIEVYRILNHFRQHTQKVTVSATKNGGGILECMRVVRELENWYPGIGSYKRRIRHGQIYRAIKQSKCKGDVRRKLRNKAEELLSKHLRTSWLLERTNQFIRFVPVVPTRKRDRL